MKRSSFLKSLLAIAVAPAVLPNSTQAKAIEPTLKAQKDTELRLGDIVIKEGDGEHYLVTEMNYLEGGGWFATCRSIHRPGAHIVLRENSTYRRLQSTFKEK